MRPNPPRGSLRLRHRDRHEPLPGSIEVADAGDDALVVDVARTEAGPTRGIDQQRGEVIHLPVLKEEGRAAALS